MAQRPKARTPKTADKLRRSLSAAEKTAAAARKAERATEDALDAELERADRRTRREATS